MRGLKPRRQAFFREILPHRQAALIGKPPRGTVVAFLTTEGQVGHRLNQTQNLTAPRLRKVAAACHEYETLILVMGTTGLRWGETTALTVFDVDGLRRRVQVSETHVNSKGVIREDTPKIHWARPVPLTAFMVKGLTLLFTSARAGPLRSSNLYFRVWMPAIQAADEPGL